MTENEFNKKLGNYLRKGSGIIAKKIAAPYPPGLPDFMILTEHGTIWLEVKTATGTLSPQQLQFRKDCSRFGVPYILLRFSVKDKGRTVINMTVDITEQTHNMNLQEMDFDLFFNFTMWGNKKRDLFHKETMV